MTDRADGPRAPAIAAALFRVLLPPDRRDDVLGDLLEEFAARQRAGRPAGARRWFRSQVARSASALALQRLHASPVLETLVAVLAGFGAILLWVVAVNRPPVLGALSRLDGGAFALAAALLELSSFVVGGLVAGRLAVARPALAALATTIVALATPVAVATFAGAAAVPVPSPWWIVLALAGVGLGARIGRPRASIPGAGSRTGARPL
ncbi:MAG: hypothetical protein R3195_12365 [Gemmatimonadota bacterium]|nr:hypothetical protein [Gemmatimonadota bacterium]